MPVDFQAFRDRKKEKSAAAHQHSSKSWVKDRFRRSKAKFLGGSVTRAAAPTSIVVGGLVAGGVLAGSGAFVAIPAAAFLVATTMFAWGKYKGRQANEEIARVAGQLDIQNKTIDEICKVDLSVGDDGFLYKLQG